MHNSIKLIIVFVLLTGVPNRINSSTILHHFPDVPNYTIGGLNLLSYNVWALPIWLPRTGFNKRYKNITRTLKVSSFDIVCLQEAFTKRFRKAAISSLEKDYFTYSEYNCSKQILGPIKRDCHGGLMTFSKFPILYEVFVEYPITHRMRVEEKIGHKGFLISLINTPQGKLVIINTHLYAGPHQTDEQHRLAQVKYLNNYLEKNPDLAKLPIIFMGDLNIDHPDTKSMIISDVYTYITEEMNFIDSAPEIEKNFYTIDKSRNKFSQTKNGKQKLDYCMFRFPESKFFKIIEQGTKFEGELANSDHLAWNTLIQYVPDPSLASISE